MEAAGGQQQRYFQRFDVCSCVVAAATQDTAEEAALGDSCRWRNRSLSGAATLASAVRASTRELRSSDSDIFSDLGMCSCVVAAEHRTLQVVQW